MFIARELESHKFQALIDKPKSSFLSVYGRRRIGKTAFIRHFCERHSLTKIEFSGKVDQNKGLLIKAFVRYMQRLTGNKIPHPINDWNAAFYLLTDYIESLSLKDDEKIVVFFDELPWIDTAKSGFLGELAEFWNRFCSMRKDIILVVCGSAASYMLKKVIHNRGSLHGRVTDIMPMQQFDLNATKQLLVAQGCRFSDKSIVDTYLVFGGVAKYLESINYQSTLTQNIENLCFKNDGLLQYEYEDIFASLFNDSQVHYRIMNILSTKWKGYVKNDLAKLVKVSNVYIKKPLDELLASGFVSATTKFNQTKREMIYRATDCFSYFYNKWMKDKKISNWSHTFNTQSYKSWSGFAFENICHQHSEHIKAALGIFGVPTKSHYWQYVSKEKGEKGAQIDLLLEHTNGSKNIDIIECKYYNDVYVLNKNDVDNIKNKINTFNKQTKNKHNIRIIYITPFGMEKNEYYNEIVSLDITITDLIETKLSNRF